MAHHYVVAMVAILARTKRIYRHCSLPRSKLDLTVDRSQPWQSFLLNFFRSSLEAKFFLQVYFCCTPSSGNCRSSFGPFIFNFRGQWRHNWSPQPPLHREIVEHEHQTKGPVMFSIVFYSCGKVSREWHKCSDGYRIDSPIFKMIQKKWSFTSEMDLQCFSWPSMFLRIVSGWPENSQNFDQKATFRAFFARRTQCGNFETKNIVNTFEATIANLKP